MSIISKRKKGIHLENVNIVQLKEIVTLCVKNGINDVKLWPLPEKRDNKRGYLNQKHAASHLGISMPSNKKILSRFSEYQLSPGSFEYAKKEIVEYLSRNRT